jgi:hypothetical protein
LDNYCDIRSLFKNKEVVLQLGVARLLGKKKKNAIG